MPVSPPLGARLDHSPFPRADIIIADTTLHYDGSDLETRPLGGTESSVIRLARELVRRVVGPAGRFAPSKSA